MTAQPRPRAARTTTKLPWQLPTRALVISSDRRLGGHIAHGLREDGYAVMLARPSSQLYGYVSGLGRASERMRAPALVIVDLCGDETTRPLIEMTVEAIDWAPAAVFIIAPRDGVGVLAMASTAVVFHPPFDLDDLRTAALHYARPLATTPGWRSWVRHEAKGGRR